MEKELQILKDYVLFYLNRHFKVEEGKVYGDDNIVKWCGSVTEELTSVFGFDNIFITETLKFWILGKKVDWEDWSLPRKLKATWSPELAQDVIWYGQIDTETELTQMLADEISREIGGHLLENITNFNQLENRMNQLGYHLSPCFYDSATFVPKKYFIRE